MDTTLFRPPLQHDHMDGAKPTGKKLPEMYALSGKPYPFKHEEDMKKIFEDVQVNLVDKFGYITKVMQSPETLELAAYAYTVGRAKQGFTYCEATIAPQYH